MWAKHKNQLYKKIEFKDFAEAVAFLNKVAEIAKSQNHYPGIKINYNIVELYLSTHDQNDVTEKDEAIAELIDVIHSDDSADTASHNIEQGTKNNYKKAKMYSDGGSRGNPGPSAYGFVLLSEDDQIIAEGGEYIGITTNNQAEYQSLKHGVESALQHNVQELSVYMDSMLVINQMKGIYKVKNRDLWPIYDNIKKQSEKFKKISFQHVPREHNKHADALVNQALDAQK